MFRTGRRPAPPRLRPPRCLPAWSHVQDRPSSRAATPLATTLLASVEPCSGPAVVLRRHAFGHHAACQRGAMFRTSRRRAPRRLRPPRCLPAWCHVQDRRSSCPRVQRLEHRSTLASSVVAKRTISRTSLVVNTAPRWRAAWWRSGGYRRKVASATTLLASVEPCSGPAVVARRDVFGHHAACQRGAMFRTSRRPAPRRLRPPRCLPAWSHVQGQSSSRAATSSAKLPRTPRSEPARLSACRSSR